MAGTSNSAVIHDRYTCNHCKAYIFSLDAVPRHECLRGSDVYMGSGNTLFAFNSAEETQPNSAVCSTSTSSTVEDLLSPEISQSPHNIEPVIKNKRTAEWSDNAIMGLLSLYEAKMNMLDHPKKKNKLWTSISDDLEDFGITMSPDQVRWKFNALLKRYKDCVDNNSKSGRGLMEFQWFDQMNEIFGDRENATANHTLSSTLPKKNKLTKHNVSKNPNDIVGGTLLNNSIKKPDAIVPSEPNPNNKVSQNVPENRVRRAHGSGSNIAKSKTVLEKQWLQHLENKDKRDSIRDERHAQLADRRKEALSVKKRQLMIREKELELKKKISENKALSKKSRHDEVMEMERLKYRLLSKYLKVNKIVNKSADESESDSD